MATLARACADNCGTDCPTGSSCYESIGSTSPKGYNCKCFLDNGPTPDITKWRKKRTEMSTDEMYKTRLLQARQAANFTNPTNPISLSCCSGGLSCVGEATCWKRIGITGVVECKCLSGNPNYPTSGGWTRYPRRAVPPTWA